MASEPDRFQRSETRELQQGFICVFARIQHCRTRNICIRLSLHRCLREVPDREKISQKLTPKNSRTQTQLHITSVSVSSSQTPWHSNQGGVPDGQQHPEIHHRFCRDYLNQTLLISERGQTDCHSGLSCLGSFLSCHPEKESLGAF